MDIRKLLLIFSAFSLHGATISVTSNADSGANTLRAAMISAAPGDEIDCTSIAGQTITLLSPLPAIVQDLMIENTGSSAVIINGSSQYQVFSVAAGTVSISNFSIKNAVSQGGAGGEGLGGGGGGCGGGGGLYVHDGASVTITNVEFQANQAKGGTGGAGVGTYAGGGGGGGFGGGAGGTAAASIAGGGGGGNSGGGAGGNSTTAGGSAAAASSSSGGGGGATSGDGGASGGFTGGTTGAGGGGGGAGAGGDGGDASGTYGGGVGGDGIGGLASYGTGGGGGGAGSSNGGTGYDTGDGTSGGGGGGSGGGVGGAGGQLGGGGGGGTGANGGAKGGLGGGGGGSASGAGGTSIFGGGAGAAASGAGGGGGAGLGGAMFVQQGGSLTIGNGVTLSGNAVIAGAGGAGTAAGIAGTALSPDIFLSSGGSLTFTNAGGNTTISSNIESDQGAAGGTGGGVTMAGTDILYLTGVNTYTGGTTISYTGTIDVSADTGLGASPGGLTFTGLGTLQAGNSFSSARGITLTASGTFDTQSYNLGLSGSITGAGSLTKLGSGALTLSGSNGYSGGTVIDAGTLNALSDASLGNTSGSVTLADATLQMGANFTSSSRNLILDASSDKTSTIDTQAVNIAWGGQITGTGPLTKIGSGTLTLTNSSNSYTGGTDINAGTLNAASDGALGNVSGGISISAATLQAGTSFTNTARTISLTGGCTIDTQTTNLTATGKISGSGSLTKLGSGILTLTDASNSYTGGTTVNAGTLNVAADGDLGASSGSLTIGNATFQAGATFSSARSVSFSSTATIDTQAYDLTLSGALSGSGSSLTKIGSGSLIFTGKSSFGNSIIINAGTLEGNSSNLIGNIEDNSALVFNQDFNGSYGGVLSGSGTFSKQGSSKLTLTGDSSGFGGTTSITAGNLDVDSTLGGTLLTIYTGGTLSGTGKVPSVVNYGGTIEPGNSIGTLTISGTLTMYGGAYDVEIAPKSSDRLVVTDSASLGGELTVIPDSGFYGVTASYTVLTALPVMGTFATVSSTDSNFVPTVVYLTDSVQLDVLIIEPFKYYKAATYNERAVANNINALGRAGKLITDEPLYKAIDAMAGFSNAEINDALDQLQPAQYSAIGEMQTEVGAQLASIFHRFPSPNCYCRSSGRVWIVPFGNWLEEKSHDTQLGFTSSMQGAAIGYDGKVTDNLVLGLGGSWNYNILDWKDGRGNAQGNSWHAAAYADYVIENFYIGGSFLAGLSDYDATRHIHYSSVNDHAKSSFSDVEFIGQVATGLVFGPSKCCLFPYLNLDVFYQTMGRIHEHGAPGVGLNVDPNSLSTFRLETGIGLQVEDTNYDETMCISPLVLLGYALETPIFRQNYKSVFQGQSIPFEVHGWNYAWNLFTLDFGLTLTYKCYSLAGYYHMEMQPDDSTSFFDQRCNVRFSFTW